MNHNEPDSGKHRVYLEPLEHRGAMHTAVKFEFDAGLKDVIKQYPGMRYSRTHKCFYMPGGEAHVRDFLAFIKGRHIWADLKALRAGSSQRYVPVTRNTAQKPAKRTEKKTLPPDISGHLNTFRAFMEEQRYSYSTVTTYVGMVSEFFRYYADRPWKELGNKEIVTYNHEQFIRRKRSYSTQNQFINAIKLFYRSHGMGEVVPESIDRPRKERKLPNVLTLEETKKLLSSVANQKHRTLLSLVYACGLRIGDALSLRLEDIRSEEGLLYVRAGKGRKDRRVPLTAPMQRMLETYLQAYKPVRYVFEGEHQKQYSYKSAQQVLKRAVRAAGLRQKVTLHTLRHSYATHQLQMGTDSRYIQEILGHNDPRTTMLYTHIAMKDIKQIKSPFDDMDIR